MKINVKQHVKGPDGEFFLKTPEIKWTLGDIFIAAIGNTTVKERTLQANFDRYDLAVKIRSAKIVEFTIDEAKTIQDCLVEWGSPFLVAVAARLLEQSVGPELPRKKKK